MSKTHKTYPGHLTNGTVFYLNEERHWPDVCVEWHGFSTRTNWETGKTEKTLIFTGSLGFKEDIPLRMPIWVEEDPEEIARLKVELLIP